MSAELKEKINELSEQINKRVHDAQEANSLQNKETEKNLTEKTVDLMGKLDEATKKLNSLEESSKNMQKAIARGSFASAGAANDSESVEKYKDSLVNYLKTGQVIDASLCSDISNEVANKFLPKVTKSQRQAFAKTLLEGNNPQGGYFVLPEQAGEMVTRIFETSPMRQLANVSVTSTKSVERIIDDEEAASGGWVGEAATVTTTATPNIGRLTIPIHKQYSYPVLSDEIREDAGFDIDSWLSQKVADVMSRTENTAFVVGDGSQKPKGFLSYPAWATNGVYERGAIEQIASGAAADFTADGLKAVQNSLIESYQGNATWVLKRASFENIITLKDSADQYIFNSRFLTPESPMTLLGKPVVFFDDMPDVAADALALAYGDFSVGYSIIDRLGFQIKRDEVTAPGLIKVYVYKRVGGAVTNYQSIKIQKLEV